MGERGDWVGGEGTRVLVEAAETRGSDLVITHFFRVKKNKIRARGHIREAEVMSRCRFAEYMMEKPANYYYGVMWNKLYRADLIRTHPDVECSEELSYSEDFYFNLSFIRYAERFYALSTPVYNYVQNPESLVHNLNPVKVLTTRWELLAYYKDLYKHLGLYEANKIRLNKYFFGIAES